MKVDAFVAGSQRGEKAEEAQVKRDKFGKVLKQIVPARIVGGKTARYGRFGGVGPDFAWERRGETETLRKA